MLENANKKFPALRIGSSITLAVPKVDRGPLDTRNIAGKVMDARNRVYSFGTAAGIIKNWFPRGEIQLSSAMFATPIPEIVVSLREVISAQFCLENKASWSVLQVIKKTSAAQKNMNVIKVQWSAILGAT